MSERFLVRTQGGPCSGETRIADTDMGWEWPLPAVLAHAGGSYVKVRESAPPPMDGDSSVPRGAEYEWRPGKAVTP
jgi:hypothetical protein